jgi:hypothetical protein
MLRQLATRRLLLDQAICDNYSLHHYRNVGRPRNDEEIDASYLAVSAACALREIIPGQWPTEPHTVAPSEQVPTLYVDVVAKHLPVIGTGARDLWKEAGIFMRTVTLEDAFAENGPAPMTYFPLDTLTVHTEG